MENDECCSLLLADDEIGRVFGEMSVIAPTTTIARVCKVLWFRAFLTGPESK